MINFKRFYGSNGSNGSIPNGVIRFKRTYGSDGSVRDEDNGETVFTDDRATYRPTEEDMAAITTLSERVKEIEKKWAEVAEWLKNPVCDDKGYVEFFGTTVKGLENPSKAVVANGAAILNRIAVGDYRESDFIRVRELISAADKILATFPMLPPPPKNWGIRVFWAVPLYAIILLTTLICVPATVISLANAPAEELSAGTIFLLLLLFLADLAYLAAPYFYWKERGKTFADFKAAAYAFCMRPVNRPHETIFGNPVPIGQPSPVMAWIAKNFFESRSYSAADIAKSVLFAVAVIVGIVMLWWVILIVVIGVMILVEAFFTLAAGAVSNTAKSVAPGIFGPKN